MGMSRPRQAQAQMAPIASRLVSPLVDVELTELAWFASNLGLHFHHDQFGWQIGFGNLFPLVY
jgi:hypothetical protein